MKAPDNARPEPLTRLEFERLARYNAEVERGLLHTDEHRGEMRLLQFRFDLAGYEAGGNRD